MFASEKTFTTNQPAGQGKRALTILTESGWHYPVISEQTYFDRNRAQTAPFKTGRGARPMHTSTLSMTKPHWDPQTGFDTTNQHYFGEIGLINRSLRPEKCRSMHNQHFHLGENNGIAKDWGTNYTCSYRNGHSDVRTDANRLHRIALLNRIDQTEGEKVKEVFKSGSTHASHWTQYSRTHNKLGFLLGPGKQRSYPVRQQFNIFTGEAVGPVYKDDQKRVSGNRRLHEERGKPENTILLN